VKEFGRTRIVVVRGEPEFAFCQSWQVMAVTSKSLLLKVICLERQHLNQLETC
jgi:hypothetical protein